MREHLLTPTTRCKTVWQNVCQSVFCNHTADQTQWADVKNSNNKTCSST